MRVYICIYIYIYTLIYIYFVRRFAVLTSGRSLGDLNFQRARRIEHKQWFWDLRPSNRNSPQSSHWGFDAPQVTPELREGDLCHRLLDVVGTNILFLQKGRESPAFCHASLCFTCAHVATFRCICREFKDVVFDNNRFSLILYLYFT